MNGAEEAAVGPAFWWIVGVLALVVVGGLVYSRYKAYKNKKEVEELMSDIKE